MNIQQLFAIVRKKMIWDKTKRIILVLIYFKMTTFDKGVVIAPNTPPQLCHWLYEFKSSHSFELRLNWIK